MKRALTYRTIDLVHAALVEELAGRHGLAVEISSPRDRLPREGETDGLIYDLDHLCLDARARKALLGALAEKPTAIPTAVHGYGLEECEVEALRCNGIVTARCLDEALLAELAAKILGTHGATAA